MRNRRVKLVSFLFLAGLVCTLALPGRRAVPAPVSTTTGDSRPGHEAAFAALVAGNAGGSQLAPEERRRLLETMRSIGPAALARFLEASVGKSNLVEPRLAALECLGGCATGRELCALVRLATPGEGAASSALRDALRSALLSTMERDVSAFGELVPAWRSAGAGLHAELLATVGERGDPAGLQLLAWVATFEGEAYHQILAETCLKLAKRATTPEVLEHWETLCTLLHSEDVVCVQTISIALARARVEAAIPAWIELLESESRGTRERARKSLEELTGLTLGATPARWLAWYESECSWYEEEAPDILSELDSEDDARVVAAVRTLSMRRLHRDELADAVVALLEHASPAVRLCACSALENLGSPDALPALSELLSDEDADVARRAWSALRRLTGLDLPLDEALWRERIPGS